MAELLLEILSEEIPARMQQRAAADLLRLVVDRIEAARLDHSSAVSHVTPRRLVVVVDGLPERQPDISEEKKGPKVGAPAQAIEGFVKANGLTSIDDAEVRETPKGSVYFAVHQVVGKATAEVLPDIIIDAVQAMPWPTSMRWATGSGRWVRPIWSVIALFDGAALRAALTFGPENGEPDSGTVYWFGNRTSGHRFMAPEPFEVADFNDYVQKLRAAKVILDRDERRRIIAEGAAALTAAEGLRLPEDPGLLDEVAGLVEWPVVLLGSIDPEFMDLPPEVLTTSMRSHQKYFSTHDKDGRLASRFLVVANMETPDDGKAIVAGNERVLRARLSDARFFWDQDRKRMLASRAPDLRAIVFHAKLGSLDDKADRMQALAVEIARSIPGADVDRVRSAARLAKADLTTGMVGEFPELQGIMGRYYATHDGEHLDVAQAVAEHYAPQGPGDGCPEAPVSVSVALADKIDTLVGFWAIGETPTGSKDPYALRRAALGVIRLIVENGLRLALRSVFQRAYALLESQIEQALVAEVGKAGLAVARGAADVAPIKVPKSGEAVLDDLTLFFADRLKVALKDKGVRHDLISAVFALGSEDDLVRLLERVKALEAFLQSDDGANLLVAFRRAANIVRIEEKKDKTQYSGDLDQSQLCQDEEKLLFDALNGAADAAAPALQSENFTDAMAVLAKLRRPVDRFFDEVTVNADDPQLRINRLRLLSRIGATLGQVADFSRIEG